MVRLDRRAVIALAGSLCLTTRPARAEQWVEVADDAGSPIPNLRVPSELDPFRLPGLLWFGAPEAEVHLFEFADYNCPVCKQAALHVDALVRGVQGLRVAFVHNPILSSQSRDAARVTLAALRIAGPKAAYALHMRLFAMRGVVDGARALAAAREEKIPVADATSDMGSQIDLALAAHEKLSGAIGFNVTPSYVLNGIGLFGHPGPGSLSRMIAAVKACDELVCPG